MERIREPLDLTVVVLTYNEGLHIRRCLEKAWEYAAHVFVVDSMSTDSTVEVCRELGAQVVQHPWPGNQAEQFNWALDNVEIPTGWILRLDADEYLLPELVDELYEKLPRMPVEVTSLSLSRARTYCGKRLRYSVAGDVRIVRLFRKGTARYEQRIMDEHLLILGGETRELEHQFVDDSLLTVGSFTDKHNNYASREAALLLDAEFGLSGHSDSAGPEGSAGKKRRQKARYARMPLFWRAVAYFLYRYIFRLGFLDGAAGFQWDFFQGLWYRMLVDAKIHEAKRLCGTDKELLRAHIRERLGVTL
ncbi:MAG: glycosyltransferase family 2 protein [Alloprevotella sp.]|nr:glycosyltransferase family 2 protein [Alloprevotella sp.]MBR1732324.1 glycosyltransferase family 2 protein [Alloprevotella sp.]